MLLFFSYWPTYVQAHTGAKNSFHLAKGTELWLSMDSGLPCEKSLIVLCTGRGDLEGKEVKLSSTHSQHGVTCRGWHGSEFSNLSRSTPTKINLFPTQSHEKTGGKSRPVHSRKNDSHSLPLPCCCFCFPPKSVSYSKNIVQITACPPY